MVYNISFDICAGIITLLTLGGMIFGRDMGRRSNRIFFALLIMHLISVIFDIWSSVCNSYPFTYGIMLRDFTNYVFLGIHTSEAVVFLVFLLEQLEILDSLNKWQCVSVLLPEILMVLLPLALNPFFHCVFWYDTAGLYQHGSAMLLLYIGADLYMAACIVLVAKNRNVFTSFQHRAAMMMMLVSVIPMLIQSILMPHQLIEIFFQALGLCGYLQSVENMDESRHLVTHAWNKHALTRDFMKECLNGEKLSVVIVKVSQVGAFMISSEESASFHRIRLSLTEWMQTNARQFGMKVYDCERGIYVLMKKGKDTAESCRLFTERVNIRFQKPWGTDLQSVIFPTQICLTSFPNTEISAHDFFSMIIQPYFGSEEGVTYVEADKLFRMEDVEGKQVSGIPPELKNSMDHFLSGISELSPAERKIFDLYVAGYEVNEMPEKAFVSINTVKKHNKNIYRKLGVGSREEIRLYVDLFYQYGRGEELAI